MKRSGILFAAAVSFLWTLPALAQQGSNPATPDQWYGHGHMWSGGYGWHPGFFFGPFMMFFAIVGLIAVILMLVRGFRHGGMHAMCGHGHGGSARAILEERFAKGEIDKAEFEEKRKILGR